MIYRNYLINLFRSHIALLGVALLLVCSFQVLILTLVEEADLMSMAQTFFQRLPPAVRDLIGEEFLAQFSTSGAVGFGYNHPLVLVTVMLVAIVLPARHVAGEIEMGTLELLFAMPVKRRAIAVSLWLGSALFLLILLGGCLAGTAIGLAVFPDLRTVSTEAVVRVASNLWLLAFAISSFALLLSAFEREGSKAALKAAGLTLFFFFLNIAARLWTAIDFLKPLSIFHYYQPARQMTDASLWIRDAAVLGSVALITGIAAIVRIVRRDVPG